MPTRRSRQQLPQPAAARPRGGIPGQWRSLALLAVCYVVVVLVGLRVLVHVAPGSDSDSGITGVGLIARPGRAGGSGAAAARDYLYNDYDASSGADAAASEAAPPRPRALDVNGIPIVQGQAPLHGPFGPDRLHGALGLRPDGTPGWVPSPPPPNRMATSADLKGNGFFRALSDSLSLNRAVPANRDGACQAVDYGDLRALPQTTVVFVFCNEALSTLLRSIHSVLNRSPPELLKEIVLVDDHSDLAARPDLGATLEAYVELLPTKVRLYRQPARLGLVKARLRGVAEATAETFTVLDSHIEAQTGWLEPLMAQLGASPKSVVMPMIDSTDANTFAPKHGGIGCSLGFLWTLVEHSIPVQQHEVNRRSSAVDSVRSPTMAGGLFASRKDWFLELGGYDPKWGFWGTENLEYSFRIWQCGGLLECMPCSRVFHVFRHGGKAYDMPGDHLAKNKLRTAGVWMDEFAAVVEYGLGFTPDNRDAMEAARGDISEQLALRDRLQCKSFSWFLDNVYPESKIRSLSDLRKLGPVELRRWGVGQAAPSGGGGPRICADTLGHALGGKIGTYGCHGMGGSQAFILFANGHWSPVNDLEACVTAPDFRLGRCSGRSDALWTLDDATGQLRSGVGRDATGGQCVTAVDGTSTLGLAPCDDLRGRQHWAWTAFQQ